MVGRHGADAYRRPNLVGPEINDTDTEVLWLIMGGPEKELEPAWVLDQKHLYPVDPTQLPVELKGVTWPPEGLEELRSNLDLLVNTRSTNDFLSE